MRRSAWRASSPGKRKAGAAFAAPACYFRFQKGLEMEPAPQREKSSQHGEEGRGHGAAATAAAR